MARKIEIKKVKDFQESEENTRLLALRMTPLERINKLLEMMEFNAELIKNQPITYNKFVLRK
ncbi:MAG: hypothetical protein JKY33_05155 [Bacteroidia bacterium]|nr:hypothetical protein [Bacteroidia bacterium]